MWNGNGPSILQTSKPGFESEGEEKQTPVHLPIITRFSPQLPANAVPSRTLGRLAPRDVRESPTMLDDDSSEAPWTAVGTEETLANVEIIEGVAANSPEGGTSRPSIHTEALEGVPEEDETQAANTVSFNVDVGGLPNSDEDSSNDYSSGSKESTSSPALPSGHIRPSLPATKSTQSLGSGSDNVASPTWKRGRPKALPGPPTGAHSSGGGMAGAVSHNSMGQSNTHSSGAARSSVSLGSGHLEQGDGSSQLKIAHSSNSSDQVATRSKKDFRAHVVDPSEEEDAEATPQRSSLSSQQSRGVEGGQGLDISTVDEGDEECQRSDYIGDTDTYALAKVSQESSGTRKSYRSATPLNVRLPFWGLRRTKSSSPGSEVDTKTRDTEMDELNSEMGTTARGTTGVRSVVTSVFESCILHFGMRAWSLLPLLALLPLVTVALTFFSGPSFVAGVRLTSLVTSLAALFVFCRGRPQPIVVTQNPEDGSLWQGLTSELEKSQAKRAAFEREQRELLRDFRKIITRELTQQEISQMRVIVVVIEANTTIQDEIAELCSMLEYECVCFEDFNSADEHLQELNESLSPMKALLQKAKSPSRSAGSKSPRTPRLKHKGSSPQMALSPRSQSGSFSVLSRTLTANSVKLEATPKRRSSASSLSGKFTTLSTSEGEMLDLEAGGGGGGGDATSRASPARCREGSDGMTQVNGTRGVNLWRKAVKGTQHGARFASAVAMALKAENERSNTLTPSGKAALNTSTNKSERPSKQAPLTSSAEEDQKWDLGSAKSDSRSLHVGKNSEVLLSDGTEPESVKSGTQVAGVAPSPSGAASSSSAQLNARGAKRWQDAVQTIKPGGRFTATIQAAVAQAKQEEKQEKAKSRWQIAARASIPGNGFTRLVTEAMEAAKNKKKVVHVVLLSVASLAKVPASWQPGEAFVALTADPEELDQLASSLGVFREGELQERLRSRGVGVTLLNPITVEALRTTVHSALHRHVADEYLLLKVLGRGATGTVYKARRARDEQTFALKEINFKRMSEKVLAEAEMEADLLGKLRWPTVLTLVDSWRSEADRIVYLLLPILDGGNLDERMIHAKEEQKKLGEAQILEWYSQALHGLTYLHAHGVLHRDLKPANLFLAADGRALRIGDLGSALQLPGDGPHPSSTAFVEGGPTTRWYAGPEVCEQKRYYAASDVFALGASFADLLALKAGFIARAFYAKEPLPVPNASPMENQLDNSGFSNSQGNSPDMSRSSSKEGSRAIVRNTSKDQNVRHNSSQGNSHASNNSSSHLGAGGLGLAMTTSNSGTAAVGTSLLAVPIASGGEPQRRPSICSGTGVPPLPLGGTSMLAAIGNNIQAKIIRTGSKASNASSVVSSEGSDFAEIGEDEPAMKREPDTLAAMILHEVKKRPWGIQIGDWFVCEVASLLHWDHARRPLVAELAGNDYVLKCLEAVLIGTKAIGDEIILQAHMRDFGKLRQRSQCANEGISFDGSGFSWMDNVQDEAQNDVTMV